MVHLTNEWSMLTLVVFLYEQVRARPSKKSLSATLSLIVSRDSMQKCSISEIMVRGASAGCRKPLPFCRDPIHPPSVRPHVFMGYLIIHCFDISRSKINESMATNDSDHPLLCHLNWNNNSLTTSSPWRSLCLV